MVYQAEVVTELVQRHLQQAGERPTRVESGEPTGGDHRDVVATVLAPEHEGEELAAGHVEQIGVGHAENVPSDVLVEGLREQIGLDPLDPGGSVVEQPDGA